MSNTNKQPLAFRMRGDVLASAVRRVESSSSVVVDPLTLEHYELTPPQWCVAQRLTRPASLDELVSLLGREFAPARFTPAEVWHLVSELHRWGLVAATGRGQAEALRDKRTRQRRETWQWGWLQLLALRLPGLRPGPIVEAAYAVVRPLLSPLGLICAAALMLLAMGMIVTRFGEFTARLPALQVLWSPVCMLVALVTIGILKTLHELGHAVVARHFGVAASEMGVMLLAGMPCLYCDVSDAWRIARRGPRMAIAAAGVGVELLIAALACLVWWYATPGIVQLVALGVMTIASLGTLLVNANPLLRYDGYYLLSDLTGVSNLWTRSRVALRQWGLAWLWRRPAHEPAVPRESPWLALYGALSQMYLTILLVVLAVGLWRMVAPRGLDVLAYGAAALLAAATTLPPLRSTVQKLRNPLERRRFRWGRGFAAALVMVAVGYGIWHAPIRHRAICPVRVDLAAREQAITTLPGQLEWAIEPGTRVKQGDVVARLASDELARDLQAAQAERDLAALRLAQAEQLRSHDTAIARELPELTAQLRAADQRIARLADQAARLAITSPCDGVVLSPADREPKQDQVRLASWSGSPLTRDNRGAWLEAGTVVAVVAESTQIEVRAGISERDIARIAPGQMVRVQLDGLPTMTLTGRVERIAERGQAVEQEQQTWRTSVFDTLAERQRHEAIVVLDQPREGLAIGSHGWAKIELGRATVGASIARWVRGVLAID